MADSERPFSSNSLWNTPVGSGTGYSASDPQTTTLHDRAIGIPWIARDLTGVYQAKASDPVATWNFQSSEGFGSGGAGSISLNTPGNVQFLGGTDKEAIIVDPNGKDYYEVWLGSHNASTNTYNVSYMVKNNVDGTGFASTPGTSEGIRGAGASLLGGLVRADELDAENIPHAIAMAIGSRQAKAASLGAQFVAPATVADGNAATAYSGTIPMGAHFAIPSNVDLSTIGLTTPEGMALAKAYQNYGGYVVDTAGNDTDNIAYLESGVTDKQYNDLQADVANIEKHIELVTGTTTPTGTPTPSQPTTPSAPTTPSTPTNTTLGSGPDQLMLHVSENAYLGDAQYTVSVDGKQVGGTQTAHAAHGSASDSLLIQGDWSAGNHAVSVNFINDAYAGSTSKDRNLYVDGATYNGSSVAGAQSALYANGSDAFQVADSSGKTPPATTNPPVTTPPPATTNPAPVTSSPTSTTLGTGSDQLMLHLSENAYAGDAQYTVSVDGKQIGGTQTAHAAHGSGTDNLLVQGDWGTGDHTVAVDFLNDAYAGSSSKDRNLYMDSASYDGANVSGARMALTSSGAQSFHVTDASPNSSPTTGSAPVSTTSLGSGSDQLLLHLSEDAYQGNAQYTVSVDGKQIGGTQTAQASHGAGSDNLLLHGNWSPGDHTVAVAFLNDAYAGSDSTDRNLYIDNASYNGSLIGNSQHALNSNGTASIGFHSS